MLDDSEVRAIAQTVVNRSKASAHVDTGALKRSISYTYVKGVVIFRQLHYGKYNDNSKLEKNAVKLMPNGTQWKIISTNFEGGTEEVSRTRTGRRKQSSSLTSVLTGSTINIKSLIAKRKARKKKKDDDNS